MTEKQLRSRAKALGYSVEIKIYYSDVLKRDVQWVELNASDDVQARIYYNTLFLSRKEIIDAKELDFFVIIQRQLSKGF